MWKDPIVAEVREVRRKIEADCGNDFDKLCERARRIQATLGNRVVNRGPVAVTRPTGTDSK